MSARRVVCLVTGVTALQVTAKQHRMARKTNLTVVHYAKQVNTAMRHPLLTMLRCAYARLYTAQCGSNNPHPPQAREAGEVDTPVYRDLPLMPLCTDHQLRCSAPSIGPLPSAARM
jgi:hypothetical protein